jgi:release factor glutamine methyltransferase
MGTGAGPIAVALAAAGAVVSACDINPRAVALARANAASNGLDVEVLESDLFSAVPGRRFDLIDFNIPFYPTEPTTHFEAAFRAGKGLGTVRRFADGARDHLAEGGRVVIVFSEDCDRPEILGAFRETGFLLEYERTTRRMLEDFHVASFRRSA